MSETTDDAGQTVAKLDDSGIAPSVVAAVGSVALALYFYYVRGDKQRGQFVGLWPATILGLAAYLKIEEIKKLVEESDS